MVKQAEIVEVTWDKDEKGRWMMSEIPGTEQIINADLVLLSMGFTSPVRTGLIESLGVALDERGNVKVNTGKQSSVDKIFAAGDVERGASLVVHAIQAGKVAAENINKFLN